MTTMAVPLMRGLGPIAVVIGAMSCAHVPPGKALIEVKNGDIYWIDRDQLPKPGSGPFELSPGSHDIRFTVEASEQFLWVVTYYKSDLRTLCVKAREGRRYQIKATAKDGQVNAFLIDIDTGKEPPVVCGPDEDED